MRLVIATANAGKLAEVRALLDLWAVDVCSLAELPRLPAVAEDGATFLENARIKARAVAEVSGWPALADDSGLEVDALGGAPGVRSARFAADAGGESGEAANIALLLARLQDVPESRRTARFRCAIAVVCPGGAELVAEGVCEGVILDTLRGRGGFGYDPVFFYPPLGRTFAELSPEEKNRASHRAMALRRLRPALADFLAAAAGEARERR